MVCPDMSNLAFIKPLGRGLLLLSALALAVTGCKPSGEAPTSAARVSINGAGATFP